MIRSIFISTLLCISSTCVVCADHISVSRSRLLRDTDTTPMRKLPTLGSVARLVLIDAITNLPIANLTNDTVINVATLPTSSFNIQAITNGVVGSIRFGCNSNMNYQVASSGQPFAFCGDNAGNYNICSVLTIGRHVVTATPFSNASATGLTGTTFQVTFRISNTTTSTEAPTKAPIASPIQSPSVSQPSCVTPQVDKAIISNVGVQ
jgi:hypothetical protein